MLDWGRAGLCGLVCWLVVELDFVDYVCWLAVEPGCVAWFAYAWKGLCPCQYPLIVASNILHTASSLKPHTLIPIYVQYICWLTFFYVMYGYSLSLGEVLMYVGINLID